MTKALKALFISIALLTAHCAKVFSQAIGTWETYFSYNNVSRVVDTGSEVFALSNGFLFSLDKEYQSIQTYSKLNGLSDGLIADIAYSEEHKSLIIVYANSNIDILHDDQFYNIPDLKLKKISNKRINDIVAHEDKAYLACGFGIVVINLNKMEIADTYIIGNNGDYSNTNGIAFYGDSIYATTDNVIKYANYKKSNLADFANWTELKTPAMKGSPKKLSVYNDCLFSLNDSSIYFLSYKEGKWKVLHDPAFFTNSYEWKEGIGFISWSYIYYFKGYGQKTISIKGKNIRDAACDKSNGTFWVADEVEGGEVILKNIDDEGNVLNEYRPLGPTSNSISRIKIDNGCILTASGGPYDLEYETPGHIQAFCDGAWHHISKKELPFDINSREYRFTDMLDVAFDPRDPHKIYAVGWDGVYEFQDYEYVKRYNFRNSTISTIDSLNCTLDAIIFDKDNNMYIANMQSSNAIQIMDSEGEWHSLYYSLIANAATIRRLFKDSQGRLWVLLPRISPAVAVIQDNNTPFNAADDRVVKYSSFNEISSEGIIQVTPKTYRCIAEDKNGAIWIGTDIGPIIFSDPSKIFDKNCYITRTKITRTDNENFADYLLANEQINAIVVDGANRKWIGSAVSGVYLLSEDGQKTIHHFTTENSPLTSNSIVDIAIDEKTGKVLIATSNGLFSYISDANEGSESYSDVHVYPNPVRPDYEGKIVIKGLMDNSVVRIADTEGNVICSGRSNGGIYTWDGRRNNGTKVSSGIYFVLMALDDGSEKAVAKIAFIN